MKHSLPSEHSLTLVINGVTAQKLICSDDALKALVYGFLYNEGYIRAASEIKDLAFSSDHSRAEIELDSCPDKPTVPVRLTGFGGAGLGSETIRKKIPVKRLFGTDYVSSCAKEAAGLAVKYAATGGMHCTALFSDEKLLMFYEDIGRHNSFDKITGRCLMDGTDARDCLLITTGRVSEDMVKKAAGLGISVIASHSTPTDKALELAENCGITLIGYIRREKLNIYCGGERLK